MRESIFYNVHDVMNILNVGKTKAYKVMAELNAELTEKGFMVVNGKVSRAYFKKRFYGLDDVNSTDIDKRKVG